MQVLTQRVFASLLLMILFHCTLIAQTATYTSTAPGDGQVGGYTYCTANGWIVVSSNYCGQSISPAFSANMNSSNIRFLAIDALGFGRTTNYPMTGGNFLLYTETTGTTPELMSEFIVRSLNNGTFPVDLTSVQVYHEAGIPIDFTFQAGTTYRTSDLGSKVVSIPSGVVTTVSLVGSGFFGFNTVQILPASNVIFGVNAFTFSDTPLPVEWSYFQASQSGDAVHLSWATQQEINTSHFDIQRKLPGEASFTTLGNLEAAGNSDKMKAYQFIDHAPKSGSLQYRIRQVDLDGNYSFSRVEEIVTESVVTLMPNPTNGIIYLNTPDQTWSGRLLDLQGKEMMKIPLTRSKIDISALPAGIYFLDLNNQVGERFKDKIVKR